MQRKVLWAALLLFVVVCNGTLGWSVMVDRDRTLVRGTAQIEATVRLIADHSARAIEASDALLRRMADMAEDWDLRDPGEGLRIWSRLVEHIDNSAPVGSAWIVDADGNLVLENWGFPPSRPGNFAHRDYFTAHLVPGAGLFVGDGQIGTATGKQRFTISRAARNPDGSLRAVVVAGVFADQMAGVLDQTAFGPKVVAGLLRGDGKVMVLRPGSDPALLARLSGQSGQVVVDGTDYVVVTRKVAGYSATVVVGVPLAAVLGQWRSRAMLTTGIAIVASVCFGLLIVAGLASARREAAAMTALEEQKRTLEQRVAERTGDLARALEAARTAGQAKDLFLATVSHDLRQPLQAMSLLAGVVSATASDDRARRLADQVAASLTYGQRLLGDLVDLAQIEAGVAKVRVGPVDLAEVLAPIATEADEVAKAAGVALAVHPRHLVARSDGDRLRQIVQNLVSNAIKNTPAGGRVLVGCRRRGGNLRIEVWDTGRGIPEAQLDAIFEQFYQIGNSARNSERGVGLGLAIVRRTADLLGHTVSVRSQVGKGSVFRVEVPAAG